MGYSEAVKAAAEYIGLTEATVKELFEEGWTYGEVGSGPPTWIKQQ